MDGRHNKKIVIAAIILLTVVITQMQAGAVFASDDIGVGAQVVSQEAISAEKATVRLEEPEVPLYGPARLGFWSLANLIIAIASLTASMVMAVIIMAERTGKRRETSIRKLRLRIMGIAAGLAAPVLFLTTEEIRNVMEIFNEKTVLMAALLIAQLVLIRIGSKRTEAAAILSSNGMRRH
ncbi:MAG: hypothetical protein LBL49_01295 [Clostridiales Family XIII bacterium]|jgi:hypothetical protein|nr:hypothetical protein [Clostridiales Family XIII bacterium]